MKRTLALILMLCVAPVGAAPQGFAFSYQGELRYNEQPVNDQCELVFRLYDAEIGGNMLGVVQPMGGVQFSEGLFTADLDFGDVFNGEEIYLEVRIGAGCGDPAATAETLPRTLLTSAPYASYAMTAALADTVDWSDVGNRPPGLDDGDDDTPPTSYTAGTGLTLSGTSFRIIAPYRLPQGCFNGAIPIWFDDAWFCGDDQDSTGFWAVGGNPGTTPGTDFIGTVDNQALEFKVNGERALRIEPNQASPSLVGGHGDNSAAGFDGAVIGGGGSDVGRNSAAGNYATVGGGEDNSAGGYAVVGGGLSNIASGFSATGGGFHNHATGDVSVVGGGQGNIAGGYNSTIAGGFQNDAAGQTSFVGGGSNNHSLGMWSGVSAGHLNVAAGDESVILGGTLNIVGAEADPTLLEICSNGIDDNVDGQTDEGSCSGLSPGASYAVVTGGFGNKAAGFASAIGGGTLNQANGDIATIGGGYDNRATSGGAAVVGGGFSTASGGYSTAGGYNAHARLWGQRAFASATFTGNRGEAQSSEYTLSNQTADASPTTLFLSGGGLLLTLPENLNMTFDLQVVATVSGSLTYYGYAVRGVAQNDSGTIYLSLDSPFESGNGAGVWTTDLVANSVDDSLDIVVTGAANTTIRWVATVRATEVIFP